MISNAFKNDDVRAISSIQSKSTINQQLIGLLIFIGLYINLHNIYQILPESYAAGSWVIVLTGIGNVFQMTGGVSSAIIGFSKYYRINAYISFLQLILLIGLNVVFLPGFGITGAAFATLVVIIVLNFLKFLIIRQKFGIQPYNLKHLLVLGIALFTMAIDALIPRQDPFIMDIIIRSSLVTIIYVGINYVLKTSQQLNDNINKTVRLLRIP
jgi:O-antigen/teichoic acid export membrane protein